MHALLNMLVFYDLHVVGRILKSTLGNQESLIEGMSALADLEALNSLACFAWESSGDGPTCYPQAVADPLLTIVGGRHPLIEPNRSVPNDVKLSLSTRVWIVTGSNMAGKSTLLRMAGMNALLAQMGTAVLACEMAWRPLRIMSDLRARDNLAKDESYFLAEIRQLRRMVLADEADAPLLGLIDEPFRGTNTDEQVAASIAVVQHLLGVFGFFMIATHDPQLASLADNSSAARNYHFSEEIDGRNLVFDYRLRTGPTPSRNALRILEHEAYPPELVNRARQWLADQASKPPGPTRTSTR